MNLSFKLFRLQQVDTQLDKVHARLTEIEKSLADDQVIREAKDALSAAQKASEVARQELQFADEEVKAQQEKIKQNQDSMYGGKVTNPKELQDLQHEAEIFSRHLNEFEDKELGKMELLESRQAELQNADKNLEAVVAQHAIDQSALQKEQSELKSEAERLNGDREAAFNGVSADTLAVYDGLRKSKKGLAVVKVNNKTCSACGAELSSSLAEAARSPNELARCDSCKRILYSG